MRFGANASLPWRLIDQPQLLDEAAVGLRETDDARGRTAHHEGTCEPLDEPGTEGVEPFEPGEVDIDASSLSVAPGGVIDDSFELGGVLGRPGA